MAAEETMFVAKLKIASAGALAVCLIVVGLGTFALDVCRPPQCRAQNSTNARQPGNKRAEPGQLLILIDGRLFRYDPAGKGEQELGTKLMSAALSPDGKWLACAVRTQVKADGTELFRPVLRQLGEKADDVQIGEELPFPASSSFVWAPDSTRVVVRRVTYVHSEPPAAALVQAVYDLATKKSAPLELPEGHMVGDWSADGKKFLTTVGLFDRKAKHRMAWDIGGSQ
jgi:hypothetical protein